MHYDAILIGAGQAAPPLAVDLAKAGYKVAIAEGNKFGGSCVNYGCTPTKTLRASAKIAHHARRASDFGIHTGEVTVDWDKVKQRMDTLRSNKSEGFEEWVDSHDNIDIYSVYAHFIGKDGDQYQVQMGDDTLTAAWVFLDVGTRAFIPPVEGLDSVDYLDNVSLLELESLPEHMIILGGGYIGLEMAQIFRRFGCEITVIEGSPHVASREDADVSAEVERILQQEGITIMTGYRATQVTQDDEGKIFVTLKDKEGNHAAVNGSHLLVATGRTPNTDTLNLESIGLQTDDRGYIKTNGKLETELNGIWALGDINKRGAFTHTSYHDYEIVRDNLLHDANRSADDRHMIYAMYTDPPLGRVGISEREARDNDKNIIMTRRRFETFGRAQEESQTDGLVKLIVDADTNQFLGACIFGYNGDDVVQVISNYMATGAPYQTMQHAVPIHPTISENFPTLLSELKPLSEWDDTAND